MSILLELRRDISQLRVDYWEIVYDDITLWFLMQETATTFFIVLCFLLMYDTVVLLYVGGNIQTNHTL